MKARDTETDTGKKRIEFYSVPHLTYSSMEMSQVSKRKHLAGALENGKMLRIGDRRLVLLREVRMAGCSLAEVDTKTNSVCGWCIYFMDGLPYDIQLRCEKELNEIIDWQRE
jgi:hypothetical protein